MQHNCQYILFMVTFLILYVTLTLSFEVTLENSNNLEQTHKISREKRQLEDLENDYPTPLSQTEEEPSFWDRVIKVAMKMFNRFIEWLNSS